MRLCIIWSAPGLAAQVSVTGRPAGHCLPAASGMLAAICSVGPATASWVPAALAAC